MDITFHIARSAANRALIRVLRGRIEIDIVQDLSRRFGRYFRFACDDFQTVFKRGECVGVHEGIFRAVRAVIIHRALPIIYASVLRNGFAWAAAYAFFTTVAKVGRLQGGRLDPRIRQEEALTYHRSVFVRE